MKRSFIVVALWVFAATLPAHAQLMLHGDHGAMTGCHTMQNNHDVHYTAYLIPSGAGQSLLLEWLCEKVPSPGLLRATIDLMDDNGREIPVAVTLVQISADDAAQGAKLLELPPKIYPAGSIEIDHEIKTSGRYEFQIGFGKNPLADELVKIPFSVGEGGAEASLLWQILLVAALAGAAGLGFWWFQSLAKRRQQRG